MTPVSKFKIAYRIPRKIAFIELIYELIFFNFL